MLYNENQQADGVTEAYVRIGNESVTAPDYVLNQLILKGMNRTYDALISEYDFKDYAFSKLNVAIAEKNIAIEVAIEVAIEGLVASRTTIDKAKTIFNSMGIDGIFGRSDVAAITNGSVTAAGNLINKLKNAGVIEPVRGFGKGKYKFIAPQK